VSDTSGTGVQVSDTSGRGSHLRIAERVRFPVLETGRIILWTLSTEIDAEAAVSSALTA